MLAMKSSVVTVLGDDFILAAELRGLQRGIIFTIRGAQRDPAAVHHPALSIGHAVRRLRSSSSGSSTIRGWACCFQQHRQPGLRADGRCLPADHGGDHRRQHRWPTCCTPSIDPRVGAEARHDALDGARPAGGGATAARGRAARATMRRNFWRRAVAGAAAQAQPDRSAWASCALFAFIAVFGPHALPRATAARPQRALRGAEPRSTPRHRLRGHRRARPGGHRGPVRPGAGRLRHRCHHGGARHRASGWSPASTAGAGDTC